jgi:ActR/RegA family two-component response regulator
VTVAGCAPSCRLIGNRDTLEQVLLHLVQNAIDASEPGRPVVLKGRRRRPPRRNRSDRRRIGDEPDFVRNRLFKPFVSTKPGGFGIGAFEARELVRAMQGRLDVESREGLGSRFVVRLPLAAAAGLLESFKPPDLWRDVRRNAATEGGMMADVATKLLPKLLIVEDDPGLQAQLKWAYEDFDVVIAGDRASALAALRAEEPAVVTLDLGLPPDPDGTSEGFAVLDAIMALKPDTKVVVASGHGARESALTAIAKGAYDFYQKPVDIEALGLIVRRALQLHKLEAENRALASKSGAENRVLGG